MVSSAIAIGVVLIAGHAAGQTLDRDGDGIPDAADPCPDEPGDTGGYGGGCPRVRGSRPVAAPGAVTLPPPSVPAAPPEREREIDRTERGRLPVRFVSRPLTLPRSTARVDVGVATLQQLRGLASVDWTGGLGVAASTGDFEVDALLAPLLLAPELLYLDPHLSGTVRFLDGDVQVGAHAGLSLPFRQTFTIDVGAPVLVHLRDVARLDTGVDFRFAFAKPTVAGMLVPLGLTLQVATPFFVRASTGFGVASFAGETRGGRMSPPVRTYVPAAAGVGVTLPGREGPVMNVTAGFGWPLLLTPGSTMGGTHTDPIAEARLVRDDPIRWPNAVHERAAPRRATRARGPV